MKKTLLEITQIILSKMDSDEVNAIGDTVESIQVAQEVETTYYELFANIKWPMRQNLISFEGVSDVTLRPNYLKAKESLDNFEVVMYNIGTAAAPDYKKICHLPPLEFLQYLNNVSGSTMAVQDFSSAWFTIRTDQHPTYYTMFDDEYLVFDSIKRSVDDTLQESKAYAIAQNVPTFSQTDDYIPEMPAKYFPMLIAEAASICFINHKGAPNSKEEQRSHRQMIRNQNNKHRSEDASPNKLKASTDYGRRR